MFVKSLDAPGVRLTALGLVKLSPSPKSAKATI